MNEPAPPPRPSPGWPLKCFRVRALFLVLLAAAAMPAWAAAAPPGTPDPAFGPGGIARITYPGEAAAASTLLPSAGGLVAVGDSATTTTHDGKLIVARFTATGRPDPSFGSLIHSAGASLTASGAILEPGGRLVVAATGTPGDAYPYRIRLLGFSSNGRLDPSFGSGGSVLLSEPAEATTLLAQPDGTLLVVGATSTADGSLTQQPYMARVSPDGHELSSSTGPGAGVAVASAVQLRDGSVLLAGQDESGPLLAHFLADGRFDSGYGPGGIRRIPLRNVTIDSMALDGAGRVLLAGAHLGGLGRSVGVPVAALLVRLSTTGALDRRFAGGGRGAYLGGETELTGVAPAPSGVVGAAADGAVLSFDPAGRPVLGFGVAGTSPLPRPALDDGRLRLAGDGALVAGSIPAPNYLSRLAVERVRLTGSGVVAPRRGASVVLVPHGRGAFLRAPIGLSGEQLRGSVAAPLTVSSISIGDGSFETPAAAGVRLTGTTEITLRGVGGTATVRGARTSFDLRRYPGGVALLSLARPRCARPTTTRLSLRGRFRIGAGGRLVSVRSRRAALSIRQVCRRPPQIQVLSGRVGIRRWSPPVVGVATPWR